MIETRCLKNVLIFIQTILSFVLSRLRYNTEFAYQLHYHNTNFFKDNPFLNCSLWVDRIIFYFTILHYIYNEGILIKSYIFHLQDT